MSRSGRPVRIARVTWRRVCRFARDGEGQAMSEYVALSGVIAVIVIASMTLFTTPVALAFIRLFRRLVLFMTSTS